jgi:hypothetical protein
MEIKIFLDLYDEEDVDRIRQNDWYVKRFLLARRRNVDEAFDMLRNTLRWRKEFGLPTMKDTDFPIEFYKIGGLFAYEKDKNGNVVIYMRVRMHRKIPELADPVKKFLMYIVNKVDREVDGNGCVIVFDCSGAGYSNMDLDFLTFLISSGNSYFPVGIKYILVYELSWVLNAFRRIAMSLIPQSFLPLIKFANKNDITDYIPIENLPDYMGGQCKRNYRTIPKGCTNVAKLAIDNGYTEDDVERILPIFEPLLEEADKAIASGELIDPPNLDINHQNNDQSISIESIVPENRTKPLYEMLGIFPNDIIELTFEPSINTYEGSVLLQNLSNTPLAFKVQSNNPNNYNVSPRLGIILESATLRFNIQLISDRTHQTRDKFLILTLPISDPKISANEFTKLWKENKSNIVSYKLLSRINSNSNNSSDINEKESQDFDTEIASLKDRCNQLERSQRRLSLLLNVMLLVIVLLSILIIYSNSYSQIFTLKLESLPNFAPKNFVSNNLN